MPVIEVEFKSIRELAKAFGGLPLTMRNELRPAVREAGNIIADQARANAGWSSRIPGAITVSTSFAQRNGGARIKVDQIKAPHARAYEGIGSRGSTFRHPVFDDGEAKTWVEERKRPFLAPAVRQKRGHAEAVIRAAIRSAMRSI